MGYSKSIMKDIQSKKCNHKRAKDVQSALCQDCYIELAKSKVSSWRDKTYIINNEYK